MSASVSARPVLARGSSLRRKVAHLTVLALSQGGVTVAAFLTQLLLARGMSQAHFGTFTSTMSLITLLVPLAVFGVAEFWLQRFGQEGYAAFRWVVPTLRLVALCSAVLVAVVVGWGLVDRSDPLGAQVRIALAPMLLALVAVALCASILQLRGRYPRLALLQLTPHALRLTVALLTFLLAASVLAAAAGFALAALVTIAVCLVVLVPFARGRGSLDGHPGTGRPPATGDAGTAPPAPATALPPAARPPSAPPPAPATALPAAGPPSAPPPDQATASTSTTALPPAAGPPSAPPLGHATAPTSARPASATAPAVGAPGLRAVLVGATPFMLGSLFYQLGINLGVVVSSELLSPAAAAVFAVPMAVLTAVYVLPRVIYQQYFLAKLHRWSTSDSEAFLAAYRVGTVGMVSLGLAIAVVAGVGGFVAIPLLFGSAYQASAGLMAVLALAIPLRFGAISVESLLVTGGLLRTKVILQGLGAAVYVIALGVTIPLFGVLGAAVTTVLTEGVLLVLFWVFVKRRVVGAARLPSWTEIRHRLNR